MATSSRERIVQCCSHGIPKFVQPSNWKTDGESSDDVRQDDRCNIQWFVRLVSGKVSIVIDSTLEAREILDGWVNEKLRLEAGLDDSDDEQIVQSNVRSVKEACNLNLDDDDPLEFLREPKDLFTLQDPSVYYETHDETELVKDILHGRSPFSPYERTVHGTASIHHLDLRSKEVLTRQQLNAIEQNKPPTVDIQTKIEERHRQVKENHDRMQKERETKRKQVQAKKDAEAQARLVVLKVGSNGLLDIDFAFVDRKNVNAL